MKYNIDRIIACAIEEVENANFAATQQFLEVYQIVRDNGVPVVSRVDTETDDDNATVYFPVQGEKFYFAVYLDTEPEISVRWTDTEDAYSVYFAIVSETLDSPMISAMTNLKPTKSWSKGDKSANGFQNFTKVIFEPNPEADEFDDKIEKLLDYLLTDKENIKRLVDNYGGYIQVSAMFHNGNTALGGVHLNKDIIRKLADLNLSIDFDLYAEGNLFKEEDGSWYE